MNYSSSDTKMAELCEKDFPARYCSFGTVGQLHPGGTGSTVRSAVVEPREVFSIMISSFRVEITCTTVL